MRASDRPIGGVERLFHLRRSPTVGTLDPELLTKLAEASHPRVFHAGELLHAEGERVDAAHFVIEGRVRLEHAGRAQGERGPGGSLGEVALAAAAPVPLTAIAESDVLTLELAGDAWLDLLEDHFEILRHVLREVCGRVIDDWQRLPPGTPPLVAKRLPPSPPGGRRDLDLVERIFELRLFAPFERASINALAELARSLTEVHLEAGAQLWREGEAARHVVLVVDGQVRCDARNGFTLQAGRGAALGALETLAARPRWYEAEVTRPLTALTGEIEVLFDVFEDNLDMAQSLLTTMGRWSLLLTQRLAEASQAEHAGAA